MHERHTAQPRQQARVFHRVPAPVAAPAQDDVGPYRPQADAGTEKQPRKRRHPVCPLDPRGRIVACEQGGQRVGKRHRHARVADEERGGVYGHGPVLQQRVHPQRRGSHRQVAVRVEVAFVCGDEGTHVLGEKQGGRKDAQHGKLYGQGRRVDALARVVVATGCVEGKRRDEPRPKQQRALAARPQAGQQIQPAQAIGGVAALLDDVGDGSVARKQAHDDDEAAHRERGKREDSAEEGRPHEQIARLGLAAGKRARAQPRQKARRDGSAGDEQAEIAYGVEHEDETPFSCPCPRERPASPRSCRLVAGRPSQRAPHPRQSGPRAPRCSARAAALRRFLRRLRARGAGFR